MRFTKYLALIGAVLFLFILWTVGPLEVLGNLLKLDPVLFLAVLLIFLPSLLLKGWKQKILVSSLGREIGLAESTKIWLIGFFFGTMTPAKAGDFFRALYLRESVQLPVGKGLAATIMERIFDMSYLFIAGLVGLILFSLNFSLDQSIIYLLAGFLLVFIAGIFFMTRKKWVSILVRPLFNFFMPKKFKQKMRDSFHDFYQGLKAFKSSKKSLALVAFLTIVSWAVIIFQYYVLALALGLPVSIEFIFWVLPAIMLIEVLPISFAGMGTRDAVTIFFFGFALVPASQAVSFSLAILFLNILISVFGLVFSNSYGLKKGGAIA